MRYIPKKQNKAGSDQGIKFKRDQGPAGRFIVLIDSREQIPWDFELKFKVHQEKLDVGDYSFGFRLHPDFDKQHTIRKMDRIFVVERKGSASEMVSMVGQERERWQRELAKLKKIPHAFIIAECSLQDFLEEALTSGVNPTSAFGSVTAWTKYLPLIWAGNRILARESFLVLARLFYRKYILGHRRGDLEEE